MHLAARAAPTGEQVVGSARCASAVPLRTALITGSNVAGQATMSVVDREEKPLIVKTNEPLPSDGSAEVELIF